MIKIVSWNLLTDSAIEFENSEEFYYGISPKALRMENRYPKIVKNIKKLNADVFMLQEVSPQLYESLREDFKDYASGDSQEGLCCWFL